ncbi:hypothetical protein [Nocardiopsis rhodophaea]
MTTRPLPVRVRLEGFPDDLTALADLLARVPGLDVIDCSRPYPNRRGHPDRCRLYLEVITDHAPADRSETTVSEVAPDAIVRGDR